VRASCCADDGREPLIPLAILGDPVGAARFMLNSFGWGPIVALNIFLPMYLPDCGRLSPHHRGTEPDGPDGVGERVRPSMRSCSSDGSRHYKIMPIVGLLVADRAVLVLAWRAREGDAA